MRARLRLLTLLMLGFATAADGQGYPPLEAAGRMTVAEGLQARLVAAEPMIRQPVAIDFDNRGRLWVIQYLQYPNPSGLERVEVDRYSRTTYDRVPEPPPQGPKGDDRITILEDTNGDGVLDHAKDFLTGLNLASGLAFGDGGLYVLQAPYLLFYPDRDGDDVPDGDPTVLLKGFGMEDAHSVANSLTWGPDGWLYGLQGSTVTANIRGIEFQQGVWRFHPKTDRFELFAEGGGNMWGLDFDRQGQLFASTNVGGFIMLHMVQGGYYWKSFGKHGPLRNPYTFGYFDHVPHESVQGGHVAVGGTFYFADAFPERLQGRYIAADLLDHSAHWHEVEPFGSSFRARQAGDLFRSNDTWFAPSDLTLGPDGSIYVADWHDQRTAHPDPDADWDRTNGRVFAFDGPGRLDTKGMNLEALTSPELVELLDHPHNWYARRARRLLTERGDPTILPGLRANAKAEQGPRALEALWTLACCGGLDEPTAKALLDHSEENMRSWVIRLLGDEGKVSPQIAARFVELAQDDPSVRVRSQLASTASRVPTALGLDIARAIVLRDEDEADPHIPLLLWWAIERHAVDDQAGTLERFAAGDAWESSLNRSVVLPRLIRRYAAEASPEGDDACRQILATAPSDAHQQPLLEALDEATRNRGPESVASELITLVIQYWEMDLNNPIRTRLAARFGMDAARQRALETAQNPQSLLTDRLALLDVFVEVRDPEAFDALIELATRSEQPEIQGGALRALGRFQDLRVASALLEAYPEQSDAWRTRARDVLFGRSAFAHLLLDAVDEGRIDPSAIPVDQVARLSTLEDDTLDARIREHWGAVAAATPEEKLAEVRRLNNDLRAASGDPVEGRALFLQHCGSCHRLFGEGGELGPDLTHANRQDRDYLLVSLVDPSRLIRKEYQGVVVSTLDGRVLTGLLAEQTPTHVTLLDPDDQRTTLPRSEIEEMADSLVSLMPENLYREFDPQALRDLFRYVQGDGRVENH